MKRILYLAMPYLGATAWGRECNIHAAREVALKLWKRGNIVICPHANTHDVHKRMIEKGHPTLDPVDWYEFDFEMVRRCDFLVLMPGWRKSTGARLERIVAEKEGIRVFEWGDGDKSLEMQGVKWRGDKEV